MGPPEAGPGSRSSVLQGPSAVASACKHYLCSQAYDAKPTPLGQRLVFMSICEYHETCWDLKEGL